MHEIWVVSWGRRKLAPITITCFRCGLHCTDSKRAVETFRKLPCEKIAELRDDHDYEVGDLIDPICRWGIVGGVSGIYEYVPVNCKSCDHSSWILRLDDDDGNTLAKTILVGRDIIRCSTGRMRRALE